MTWNRHLARLVQAAVASGLLVACGSSPAPSGPTVQPMGASWAEHYSDLAALKEDSDVAIIGTVTGVASRTVRDGIPYTEFDVRVVRALHDPRSRLTSSTIVVHQTGGPVSPNRVLEVRDDPLFRTGETVALFLRQYAPGHFRVLGGPAGRFEVSQGTVVASSVRGSVLLPGRHSVDQFATEVAKAR